MRVESIAYENVPGDESVAKLSVDLFNDVIFERVPGMSLARFSYVRDVLSNFKETSNFKKALSVAYDKQEHTSEVLGVYHNLADEYDKKIGVTAGIGKAHDNLYEINNQISLLKQMYFELENNVGKNAEDVTNERFIGGFVKDLQKYNSRYSEMQISVESVSEEIARLETFKAEVMIAYTAAVSDILITEIYKYINPEKPAQKQSSSTVSVQRASRNVAVVSGNRNKQREYEEYVAKVEFVTAILCLLARGAEKSTYRIRLETAIREQQTRNQMSLADMVLFPIPQVINKTGKVLGSVWRDITE